jgi:hypothetical protein
MSRILFIAIILFSLPAFTNESQGCPSLLSNDFIRDGRNYSLSLNLNKTARLYVSFFEGYQYRIAACSKDVKNFSLNLYDTDKNLLFSGNCENFEQYWNLRFKNTVACIAEISVNQQAHQNGLLNLLIGYKDLHK